jgi:hypothetical protein
VPRLCETGEPPPGLATSPEPSQPEARSRDPEATRHVGTLIRQARRIPQGEVCSRCGGGVVFGGESALKAWGAGMVAIGALVLSGCATTPTTSSEASPAAQATSTESTSSATQSTESTPPPTRSESSPSPAPESSPSPAPPEEKPEESRPEPEKQPEPEPEQKPAEAGCGGEAEGPGSSCHAEDGKFCSEHACIANFPNGSGTVVQCTDGEYSHSGGRSGACSHHGGESNKP